MSDPLGLFSTQPPQQQEDPLGLFAQATEQQQQPTQAEMAGAPFNPSVPNIFRMANAGAFETLRNVPGLNDWASALQEENYRKIQESNYAASKEPVSSNLSGIGSAAADIVTMPAQFVAGAGGAAYGAIKDQSLHGAVEGMHKASEAVAPSTWFGTKESSGYKDVMGIFDPITGALDIAGKGYGELTDLAFGNKQVGKDAFDLLAGLVFAKEGAAGLRKLYVSYKNSKAGENKTEEEITSEINDAVNRAREQQQQQDTLKVSGSVVSEALKRTEQEVADKEKSTGTALSEQEKSDIYNKHLSEATAADYINKRDTIGVEAYKEYEKTVKELERQVKRKLSPDEKQIVYDDFVQNKKSQPTATTPEGQQGEFDFKYIDPAELKAQTEARGGDLFSEENLANQQRVAEAGKPPTLAELKAKSEQERISRIMQQMEEAKRNQEQGDLFKEREANKQADVESAYRQRTQQEFESAQRESEAQKRGLGEVPREDYQPSQRGPEMANPTRPTQIGRAHV